MFERRDFFYGYFRFGEIVVGGSARKYYKDKPSHIYYSVETFLARVAAPGAS